MKPFKIRDILIDPPLILSPMAGVTDFTFRRLIKRRGGVGLVVSEFISVEGLTRQNPKSKRQMHFDEEERPFAVQIFGGKADRMAMGAEMAQEVGADILDVNCGCPAPKVVKNGGGSGPVSVPGSAREYDAAKIAGWAQPRTVGSAAASEAFFPFPDGLETVAQAGATAVIQPGGSVRDPEVIAAADRLGAAMVFTGMRHFRH